MASAEIDRYSDLESDSEETLDDTTIYFNAAAKHLQSIINSKTIENDVLLQLYGLYKVSTVGRCTDSRPNWYDFRGKQKWDAWNRLSDLTKHQAQSEYIKIIKQIDPEWSWIDNKANMKSENWVSVSSMLKTDVDITEDEKNIFDFVKDGNLLKVKQILETETIDINKKDENGLGLIHWACDRGFDQILKVLLNKQADINLQTDDDHQTGLHYAASCGHLNCVEILLTHGICVDIQDAEGERAADVASDSTIADFINKNL